MATNKLNALICYLTYGNTGESDCDIEEDFPVGDLLIPRGKTFTAAETATATAFATAIQAGLVDDDPNDRFYWIGDYDGITPTGEAPVVESFGSGRKRQIRRGTVGADLLIACGKQKAAQLIKFSGKHGQFDAIRLDRSNVIWGRTSTTQAGVSVLGGRELSNLFVGDYMANDGSKGGQLTVSMEYRDSKQVNETFGYVQMDSNPMDDGTGLISVLLTGSSSAQTTITITGKTAYGGDLHALYATELAVVSAFRVFNAATRGVITVSAVAATTTGWTITIPVPGTDPDNPGTGNLVAVSLALPSILDGLNVPGIESNEILVTLG